MVAKKAKKKTAKRKVTKSVKAKKPAKKATVKKSAAKKRAPASKPKPKAATPAATAPPPPPPTYQNKDMALDPPPKGPRRWTKWLRRGFGYTFLLLFTIIVGTYFFVTINKSFTETFLLDTINKGLNGKVSFKIKQLSLFRGIIIDDIEVLSGPDFKNKPLVKMDRFSMLYNISGFWAGDFGVHEVGIYKPRIYMIKRKNKWNLDTLVKPSKKKKEKEEEKEEEKKKEEAGEGSGEPIKLPFAVRVFFKFVLEDFYLSVDGDHKSNKKPMEAELKNFTFRTHILTKSITEVPVGVGAVSLIDTFLVQLNPHKKMSVRFREPGTATKTPFSLHWLLAYDGHKVVPTFNSRMRIGEKKIPLKFKGKKALLNFLISYNLDFDPAKDKLTLDHFKVAFMKRTWLRMAGSIKNVTKGAAPDAKKPLFIDLKLDKSDINLTQLYPLAKKFGPPGIPRFGGSISLAPLKIKGGLSKLHVDGKVRMKGIKAAPPGQPKIRIPYFNLYYDILANANNKGSPLGFVRYAKLGWRGKFNGAGLKADIHFDPKKKTDVGIFVNNFNVVPFAKKDVKSARVSLGFTVKGKKINNLKSRIFVKIPHLVYMMNRGKSGINKVNVNVSTRITAPTVASVMKSKNLNVNVTDLSFALKNKFGQKGVWLNSSVSVKMPNAKKIDVTYNLEELGVHVRRLYPGLTESLKESMAALHDMFKKKFALSGKTKVKLRGKNIDLAHQTKILLYDFDIKDIVLDAKVQMRPKKIKIPAVTMTGLNNALDLLVKGELAQGTMMVVDPKNPGKLKKQKGMVPDIKVAFSFGKKERDKIFQNHAIKGSIGLNVHQKGQISDGMLIIDKFYYDDGAFTKVNNVNMRFPFLFKANLLKTLNLTAANKERIIKNYNFSDPFNFSIHSVQIQHPTKKDEKGEPAKEAFDIIYPQGKYPAFGATMRFRDNVFEMPALQIFLLNGLISGQDILFNLGTGDVKKMEFLAQLQVKEIDLKQLIPADKAKSITDGALSMDMFVLGKRMDQPIDNIKGYVSVYKIGEEFGKQGLKVVKPDSNFLVDAAIDNSIVVKKIDLEMKEGLVYASIHYDKGVVAQAFVSPKGNAIEQSRIPISQFISSLQEEAAVYQVDDSDQTTASK